MNQGAFLPARFLDEQSVAKVSLHSTAAASPVTARTWSRLPSEP